ncbi:cytochrome P450 [Streptomyces sp. NPDC050658]|uniref:cytochrome P450 n=1 Tax=unclassified Streptomyces TaxID=2593676 RepID=UPI0034415858
MTTAPLELIDFPFSANGLHLPEEIDLLRGTPVRKVRTIAGDEAWLVSSYALCKEVLEDERYSLAATSAPGVPRQYALTIPPHVVNNMSNMTGAGLRKAVMKAINPKSPRLRTWMREHAAVLVDDLLDYGPPADLRDRFAARYAEHLHARILGISPADAAKLGSSLDIAFMNSATCPVGARLNWDRDIAYVTRLLDDPETTGLMGALAELRDDPAYAHLTDETLATVGVTLLGAGVVSTMGALSMVMVTLLQNPELWRELCRRPERIPAAVDELLRVNLSIADGLPRLATTDMSLGGVDIKEGELVLVLVEAANSDPAVFPDPHTIDLGRPNASAHLSFGRGGHYCPAVPLGKEFIAVALDALAARMPGLRLAVPEGQLVWRTGYMKRLPERLPVAW